MTRRTVEEDVNLLVREWAKNGLITKKVMFQFISTSIPMLEKTQFNSRNGNYVSSVPDYVCYLIEVLIGYENAVAVLAYLRSTDKTLYDEVVELLTVKDLVSLTKTKSDVLESKNLDKVAKVLRSKLDKQIKLASQEIQNNI